MKELKNLVSGDYVFFLPTNDAILITDEYKDGCYMTCSLAAVSKHSECYRIATKEEIVHSIQKKKSFEENMRKIWDEILKNDE